MTAELGQARCKPDASKGDDLMQAKVEKGQMHTDGRPI
jgi:hypothetical protein